MNTRKVHKEKQIVIKSKRNERKYYITPKLIKYGSVEKMTQSGGSKPSDVQGVRQR